MAETLPLALYRVLSAAAEPAAPLLLRSRLSRGKEDAGRLGERLGRARTDRPSGPLLWVHGASVGELNAVLPLVARLLADRPGLRALVTTGTVTSATLAAARLPPRAFHQFTPLDGPRAVRRFLDHWRPDLALFVESELWPNLLAEAAGRGIPLVLVNGRMSDRSFARWRRVPRTARAMLSRFALIAAQSEGDARRFEALGAPHAASFGNLKFDGPPPPVPSKALAEFGRHMQDRPLLAAASTHEGEEAVIAEAHAALETEARGLLTLLAPRHPERGPAIAAMLAAKGLRVARRAAGETPTAETDVYLMDTLGELGLLYAAAPFAFIGGSLVARGGQNPIEAAKLGCAVLHGPKVPNFRDVYGALDAAGAAIVIRDAASLTAAARRLLDTPEEARAVAARAREVVAASEGALARTLEALAPFLPQEMSR